MKKLFFSLIMLLPLIVSGQGRLYERYAARQDLTVAEVSGFRLSDSVRVDVVLLVADDEKAWRQLMKEYDIRGTEGTTSWLGEADQPARRTRWTGQAVCKVIASHANRTIAFYRLETMEQYEALLDFQLGGMGPQLSRKP